METSVSLVNPATESLKPQKRRSCILKRCLYTVAFCCLVLCPLIMGVWMYLEIQKWSVKVYYLEQKLEQVSMNPMIAPSEKDISIQKLPIERGVAKRRRDVCPHACQQNKQFESIHLSIDTGKKPSLSILKQNEKIKAWKLQDSKDKTGGLRYDPSTGEVIIAVSGYYYVYAQLRPAQDTLYNEWLTIVILQNDDVVAATSLEFSRLTAKSLSRSLYLKKNDRISVKLPPNEEKIFRYSRSKGYSFFGLYLLAEK